jgi:hypothetical protein
VLLKADIGIGQIEVRDPNGEFFDSEHFNPLDETHPVQPDCST